MSIRMFTILLPVMVALMMVFWPDRTVQVNNPDAVDTPTLEASFRGFHGITPYYYETHPAPELDAFHRGEIPLTALPRLSYGPRDDPDSRRQISL